MRALRSHLVALAAVAAAAAAPAHAADPAPLTSPGPLRLWLHGGFVPGSRDFTGTRTFTEFAVSRFPVGSSHNKRLGSPRIARAIATR